MVRLLTLLIALLLVQPVAASNHQYVAGAGPSTVVARQFFKEFNLLPEAGEFSFEVPDNSVKHAGGIRCSDYNLLGRTGRPLSLQEKKLNKEEILLAEVPIVFVIGKKAGITRLSLSELEQIITGRISNWQELGGTDHKIVLVGREDSEALFSELKSHYDFFARARFSGVVTNDDHVINFLKSPQGAYGLTFGAAPNLRDFQRLTIDGYSAGVRLGLVFDRKNGDHPVIKAVREYAGSGQWRKSVEKLGLLAIN